MRPEGDKLEDANDRAEMRFFEVEVILCAVKKTISAHIIQKTKQGQRKKVEGGRTRLERKPE